MKFKIHICPFNLHVMKSSFRYKIGLLPTKCIIEKHEKKYVHTTFPLKNDFGGVFSNMSMCFHFLNKKYTLELS